MRSPEAETARPELAPVIIWATVALVAAVLPMAYLASGAAFQLLPVLTAWPWAQTWIAGGAALSAVALAWIWRARFDPVVRGAVYAATAMAVLSTSAHVLYVTVLSHQLPAAERSAVQVGSIAPDIQVTAPDGRSFALSDHRGQRIALVFYRGTW